MGDKKYSEIEIQTAKNLIARGYEWLARDKNDTLFTYKSRPAKGEKVWAHGGDCLIVIATIASKEVPIFKSIRWEDAEPVSLRDIVPLSEDDYCSKGRM